jgi:hypothetical protein
MRPSSSGNWLSRNCATYTHASIQRAKVKIEPRIAQSHRNASSVTYLHKVPLHTSASTIQDLDYVFRRVSSFGARVRLIREPYMEQSRTKVLVPQSEQTTRLSTSAKRNFCFSPCLLERRRSRTSSTVATIPPLSASCAA